MSLFDFLFGNSRADEQYEQNIKMQRELQQQNKNFINRLEGEYGLGQGLSNPGGFINNIASQYQNKQSISGIYWQSGQSALGNYLRASGLDKSTYGLGQVANLNHDLASKGLNSYIESALGGYGTNLRGLLGAYGLNAQMGQNLSGAYTTYGNALNDRWGFMNKALGGLGQGLGMKYFG